MKKLFTLFILLLAGGMFAQQKIAERVAELKRLNANFQRFSVLDATSGVASGDVSQIVKKAAFAKLRLQDVNAIASTKPETIEIDIPYLDGELTVELYKANIFNQDFHIDTDKQKNIDYTPGAYYRGIIKGEDHSVVAMNFFNGEMSGIISGDNIGNVVVGKLQKANNVDDYIVYSDADLTIANPFNCGMKADAQDPNYTDRPGQSTMSPATTKCATIYFELDYQLYVQNGSSTTAVGNWITSVFNNVSTLYNNETITVSLRSTFIWTTQDPYSGDSSGDYLQQFNEVRPVFDADLGMLCGIDPGGLGGIAVTINGLCSTNNFSYSDVELGFNTVPTYSWTVEVVTHELGHLLGSPHTHACVWNGNNTAIDNCAPFAIGSTSEGYSCMTSPPTIPSTTAKGTIMSYCHLVSGVGISFASGFGPQPAARIISAVNSANCLSTDCVTVCINTVVDIEAVDVTTTTAAIHWNEIGSENQWQVLVNAFPATPGAYTTVSNPAYNASNLQPNTFYKARIRPTCMFGQSPAYRQKIFATAADWCSGVTITDTGGTSGDYTNDQDYTRVMIPTQANKRIALTITQLDLENEYDYLYVYDGASTSATDLTAGGLTGEDQTGPFPTYVSSSPDGALTLRFYADQGVTESGYTATVGCEDMLGVNAPKNIDFTYYPNPAKDAVNIISKTEITSVEVYNVTGQLLYANAANALETKVDMASYSTGTYFFKLKFGEYSANFKIMKF